MARGNLRDAGTATVKPLIVSRQARHDHRDAVAFYDDRSGARSTGDRFTDAVNKAFDLIAEDPHRFGFSPYGSRRFLMEDFPFEIHFVETDRLVIVVAIWDHHRDPDRLQR